MSNSIDLTMKQKILIIIISVILVAIAAPFLRELIYPKKAEVWRSFAVLTIQNEKKSVEGIHPSLEACSKGVQQDFLAISKASNPNDIKSGEMICGMNCKDNGYFNVCENKQVLGVIKES